MQKNHNWASNQGLEGRKLRSSERQVGAGLSVCVRACNIAQNSKKEHYCSHKTVIIMLHTYTNTQPPFHRMTTVTVTANKMKAMNGTSESSII